MKKLAKIESPSPDEKKHISEEEMYIDQPVVDNAKNNKILYKRSMKKMSNYNNIYEEMVKEAYENIVDGLDKEAYHEYSNIPQGQLHKSQKAYKAAQNGATVEKIHEIATKAGVAEAVKDHIMNNKKWYGTGAGAVALAGLTTAGIKALKNKKKSQEEETAEKAAAYYEAAIMAKEAAEADYTSACAYEDAALEILADLGYID